MSFSYASDVITQTGTDSDLSGLEGLTGVTVFRLGGNTDRGGLISYPIIYQLTKRLVIEGDLTYDASGESLTLISGQNAIIVKSGGSLNISALYQGTPTRALAINANLEQFGAFWQSSNSVITAESGSSVDFEGITIGANQNLFLNQCNGTIKNCVIIGDTQDEPLVKIGENLSIDGLEVIGTHGLIFGGNNDMVIKNVTVKSSLKVTQHDATGWNWTGAVPSFPTFEDYTSNGGSQIDFRMWWNGGYKVLNSATGSDLNNKLGAVYNNMANGFVWLTKNLSLNYSDSSGTAISGVKTRINDFNNGSRRSLQSVGDGYLLLVNTTPDFSTDLTYSSTSDSSGDSAELEVTTAVWTGSKSDSTIDGQWDYRSKNNANDDIFDIAHADYNYLISVSTVALKGLGTLNVPVVLFSDSLLTELDKTIVDAYTEIDTPQKFYDRAKSYLVDNFAGETTTIVSRAGNEIDLGSYDLDIDANATEVFTFDGSKITIKASIFVGNITTTGGTISLLNDAEIVGSYGGVSVLPFTVTNVEAGSTVQLYNVTGDNEISNAVVSGTTGTKVTYSGTYANSLADPNDEVRLRITCQSGVTALLPFETFGVASVAGISFKANQVDDTVYNNNAIDGGASSYDSASLEIDADYTNFQLDVSDTDNPGVVTTQQIYAKYAYLITTTEGIEKFFGAITAENGSNYRINTSVVDLKIQNISSSDMIITGARLYRDDNTTVIIAGSAESGTLSHDTGEFLQYIQPQVTAAMNEYGVAGPDDLNPIKKNTKLIPGLL